MVRERHDAQLPVSPYRLDLSCKAGLEQATPTFDEAPARVDQRYDEHRRHDCTDEEAGSDPVPAAFATSPTTAPASCTMITATSVEVSPIRR